MPVNSARLARWFAAGLLVHFVSTAEARKQDDAKELRIRAINVEVKNIFDPDVPGEDHWPYTWANAVHIRTRAMVIRKYLLMRPGDIIHRELIDESERNLRSLGFIKDARIIEVPVSSTESDLLVKTQDSWTTQPQIDFGSAGGQSHFAAGVEEDNVLGFGKTFSYFYRHDKDGVSNSVSYDDPQIGNSRYTMKSQFVDGPFGDEEHLNVQRPFYSLQTRYAGGGDIDHVKTIGRIFNQGTEVSRYSANSSNFVAYGGVKLNNSIVDIHRLQLNYSYTENVYSAQTATVAGTLPKNRALSGPTGTWTFDQNDFIKETFVDRAERIEDINLGHDTRVALGYSDRTIGATENSVPFTIIDSFGFGGSGSWFGLTSYGIDGRYHVYAGDQHSGGRVANTVYFANLNLYDHLLPEFPLTGVMHLESAYVQNPDVAQSLELGGDTGLRGFRVTQFSGNKSILGNLETRFFYPYEVLHLAYLGGAAFLDVGQVQTRGEPFNRKDWHADIGIGLRIGLTRSTVGTVYRIDVAYALGPIPQSNRVIVSISSGQGFKRNGNTYGKIATNLPNS